MSETRIKTRRGLLAGLYSGNIKAVFYRGMMAAKGATWVVWISGFFEPVLYLLAMGFGMGALVGAVVGPGGGEVSYAAYIAPALLAVSAMNGGLSQIWCFWSVTRPLVGVGSE